MSLPDRDVAFLDHFATHHEVSGGRSGAVQAAIRTLREADLEQQYAAADAEWKASGDAELWDNTVGDGISDQTPA